MSWFDLLAAPLLAGFFYRHLSCPAWLLSGVATHGICQ